jgi:ribosomal protein S18 acetylase RimI-like enzyme
VAIQDGRVVGYLTGCVDSRQYIRSMAWRVMPKSVLSAIGRGFLFKKETWSLAWAGILTGLKAGNYRKQYLDEYPAHFHLNVVQDCRGQGVGRLLVEKFFDLSRKFGLGGIHLAVRADNQLGLVFFQKMGFVETERRPTYLPFQGKIKRHDMVVLCKKLGGEK